MPGEDGPGGIAGADGTYIPARSFEDFFAGMIPLPPLKPVQEAPKRVTWPAGPVLERALRFR